MNPENLRSTTDAQVDTEADIQNRTATGQTTGEGRTQRHSKTHQDYWKKKLRRRSYVDRGGERVEIPEWQVRMFHLNREGWFNLGTVNQSAAAVKARDIWLSLKAVGWAATESKFKPSPTAKLQVCTVGEFIGDVGKRSGLKAMTLRRYAVKLRKMVVDIAGLEKGLKKDVVRSKYDYANGGRNAWLVRVDGASLGILTPETINAWRDKYVASSGSNPVTRKSAERSAASYIRCVRALFAREITDKLQVKLPLYPFAGVQLKDPGAQRYHSEVSPELLISAAARELKPIEPQQYLALLLCLPGGLRRKEADLLLWSQIDLSAGQIHVRRTEFFEPKTEESVRSIDMGESVVEELRAFKDGATSDFVLVGADPNPDATYDYYRCDGTWRGLIGWLRSKGVRSVKAIHTLRKESGSLIASEFDIEAARQHLGHRDIRTTSAHYVGKKSRREVGLSVKSHLKAANE